MPLPRIAVEKNGLRERHEGCAEHALQQAKDDHLLKRCGHAAQHGCRGEADNRHEEKPFAPEPVRKESGNRRHDGSCNDVGGQYPIDLVKRRRKTALHIGQRDIGDCRVERLHDRGEHHAKGDDPAVRYVARCLHAHTPAQ